MRLQQPQDFLIAPQQQQQYLILRYLGALVIIDSSAMDYMHTPTKDMVHMEILIAMTNNLINLVSDRILQKCYC